MAMEKSYGNSWRFLALKWLQPAVTVLLLAICWCVYYVPEYVAHVNEINQLLLLIVYAGVLLSLDENYHALQVGLLRVSELIYSQSLANVISGCMMYVLVSVYVHQMMALTPLLCVIAIQCLFSVLWSLCANALFFRTYQPPKTAIIYRNQTDLMRIQSIPYFQDHFDVQKKIEDPENDIYSLMKELEGYEVIFVAGIHATLRNGLAKFCVDRGVKGYFVPHLGDIILAGAEYMSMFSVPVMKVNQAGQRTEYLAFKRLMDLLIAGVGIVLTSPLMLLAACAIKLQDGGPVFYKQVRLTQNRREFSILKFRSMTVNAEKDGVARLASENDSRITPVGKIIRATRIDELPQLFNILRGEMSVVGPRPERPEIAAQYEEEMPEFSLRLQVKAGLTGLAQVYGRYNTEPYSKLQMDLMYINDISLLTDIKILFATVKIVFMKESTQGVGEGMTTAADAPKENTHKKSA